MALRISAFIILLLSILFMPFWLSAILALLGMIFFSFFWEAVLLLFLSDLIFGIKEAKFFGTVFVSSIVSAAVLIMLELLKKKLKFYEK